MRKWQLMAGGLLVGLLLAEGVCRLVVKNPITDPPDPSRISWRVEGLVSDPLLEYSFQPGYSGRMTLVGDYDVPFRINGQGLRDDQDFPPEHPDRRRILLVGDSFVFGIGVELQDTLGEQLERALAADGSKDQPVEVVAAGVPGYGLDDYTKLVERWVPRLHPDLVIVGLFGGNDLVDYELEARDRQVVIEGKLVKERQAWSWNLRKWSVLAHLLLQRFNPYDRIDRTRSPNPQPEELARIFKSMQPWIERLAAAPGPGGPPIAVWLISGKEMIERQRGGQPTYTVAPLTGVLAALRKAGCRVLDPTPAWLAAEPPVSQYFFPRDLHYSEKGNRLMAGWLATQLRTDYLPYLRDRTKSAQAAKPR